MSYFTADKGIYQRLKFGYKWVRFVIFYFSGGAVNLGDGSPLVSNQLSQAPDSLHQGRPKPLIYSPHTLALNLPIDNR